MRKTERLQKAFYLCVLVIFTAQWLPQISRGAQPTSVEVEIGLTEALNTVLKNSIALKKVQAERDYAYETFKENRVAFLPTIDLKSSALYRDGVVTSSTTRGMVGNLATPKGDELTME